MECRIPKRIIQTGRHVQQPLQNQAMMANVRLLNPDYEYLFFDDEGVRRFIEKEFPQHQRVFDSFRFPIQRYDFFRYLAVYRYGGFYFDLDVMLASSLSSLSESGCVFPFEGLTLSPLLRGHHRMDWEIGNSAFGAGSWASVFGGDNRKLCESAEGPGLGQTDDAGSPISVQGRIPGFEYDGSRTSFANVCRESRVSQVDYSSFP